MIVHNPTRTRCRNYTSDKSCVCRFHQKLMTPDNTLSCAVKRTPLAEIVARRVNDPAYKSIREEIGLMRAMLELLYKEFHYVPGEEVDRVQLNAIMQCCRMIGEQVKTLTDIDMRMNSRMSIEQLGTIAEKIAELVINTFQPDVQQCKLLEDGMSAIINPLRPDGVDGVPALEGEDDESAIAKFVEATTGVSETREGTSLLPGVITQEMYDQKRADANRLLGAHNATIPLFKEFLPPGVSRQCEAVKHFLPIDD
jgi:hypothetical protein